MTGEALDNGFTAKIFVYKFNSTGGLIFSTYIGGNNYDFPSSIAIDNKQNIFITGQTTSPNFPIKNAFDSTYGGSNDAFVTKFNATGDLVFSTFLGGSNDDMGMSISVDSMGNCYVTGETYSTDFPTKNAYNAVFGGLSDAFIAKFDTTGKLVFSTYFGGKSKDASTSIGLDNPGNSYIVGITSSRNFPTKNAYNATYGDQNELFLAKFSANLIPITIMSSPSVANSLFYFSLILFVSVFLLIIVVITVYIGVEYRNYTKIRSRSSNKSKINFIKFLRINSKGKSKFHTNSSLISDKTIELLSEIEKETDPKQYL